jgi:hypothetical protein
MFLISSWIRFTERKHKSGKGVKAVKHYYYLKIADSICLNKFIRYKGAVSLIIILCPLYIKYSETRIIAKI